MSEVNHGIAHSLRFNQDHLALIKPPELFRGLSLQPLLLLIPLERTLPPLLFNSGQALGSCG